MILFLFYPTIVHPLLVAIALSSAVSNEEPQLLVMVTVFDTTPDARLLNISTKALCDSLELAYVIVFFVPESAALLKEPQLMNMSVRFVPLDVFNAGTISSLPHE